MRHDLMKEIGILLISLPLIALTACGGSTTPSSPITYTVGGTVSGLSSSASVVLLDNGGDALTVSANGAFTFATPLAGGAAYAATVGTQPSGETCTVASGSGTVGAANVTSIAVSCAVNTYTIGGTVTGLAASASVVLLDNGGDALTVSTNGAFTFATALAGGSTFSVTVGTQPAGETCTVSSGSGTVATANVTSVAVACTAIAATTYSINVQITNLLGRIGIALNGGAPTTITNSTGTPASESFSFLKIANGTAYDVTVATQPTGYTCATSDGSGTIASADVTVNIACTVNPTYSINVQITNLLGSIGIALNGGAPTTITNSTGTPASESFSFLKIANGTAYDVTVATQPTGYTCATSDGSGTIASADVTVNIACTVNPTYSINVQITNLLGSIGIALNGGAPTTITNSTGTPASESFSFLKIANGTAYDVTVATQPTGYTCATSDGSGTIASADVTVNIGCTANGSGGTGGFWIPYSATPASSTSGQGGLFVIASNTIASSPAPSPTFVTTSVPTVLGAAYAGFISGTTPPASVTPAVMIYAAVGSDGNTHVYGLDLTDTSAPPVPTQITNLSVPSSEHICYGGQVESDLTTPNSLAVVMYVTPGQAGAKPGTVGYCGWGTGTFELAHYTDSPTATPVTLNIPGGTTLLSALQNDIGFTPLYQTSGALGGIVLWDASTGNLDFYSDATFTSSSTLLSNVSAPVACVNANAIANGNLSAGGRLLANVTTASGTTAYQITAAGGAPAQFFAGDASSCVADSKNLYFIGTPSGGTASTIYQEPLAATPPAQQLFALPTITSTEGSSLIGSNGTLLFFENYSETSGSVTSSIFSVPEGVASTSATAVGSPYSGNLESTFLASPTGNAANDLLFVTALDETSSGVNYSSQALSSSALVGNFPDTVLGTFGPLSPELDGNILEIDGVTDTNGGYGGGTINALELESLTPAPLTTTGGSAYTVPSGYVISLNGFYGTNIATGFMLSVATPTAPYIGVAVDLSHQVILPLNLTYSSVQALF